MANWKACTDSKGQKLWVNLETVTTLMWSELSPSQTEISFVGGGGMIVRERPENLMEST